MNGAAEMNENTRNEFPALRRFKAYLNTASIGLPPNSTVNHLVELINEIKYNPDMEDYFAKLVGNARYEVSKLINAHVDEIAFSIQTTDCLKKAIAGLRPDDDTVIYSLDLEFPSVSSIVESICRHVRCKYVILELIDEDKEIEQKFEEAMSKNTYKKNIILVSSVNWITGTRIKVRELADIAHIYNGLLIIDGVQHVGALKLDVRKDDVDVLCCGGEKWLLTPYLGAGLMYVKHDLLSQLELPPYGILNREEPHYGWSFYWPDQDKDPWILPNVSKNAIKYEWGGGLPYLSICALHKSIEFINKLGIESIENHLMKLRELLTHFLIDNGYYIISPVKDPDRASSIITFRTGLGKEMDNRIVEYLKNKGVMVSYRGARGIGGIRISPHLYNTKEDIDVFFEELKSVLKKDSKVFS